MYIAIIVFLIIILVCIIFQHYRKKKIVKKICSMTPHQRTLMLNIITKPFGYIYDSRQKIFTNTEDPWQKSFGYNEFYDRAAPYFNMIFHCLPIYFDYDKKTWLLEFWKGQYGINIGCEAGQYRADTLVPQKTHNLTLFKAVPDEECLEISTQLFSKDDLVAHLSRRDWWLTIFSMGHFSKPQNVTMKISITFPNVEMLEAFLHELCKKGYPYEDYCICHSTITFILKDDYPKYFILKRIYCNYVLFKNHILCKLYNFITRPFTDSREKLLYLYYYLPFVCRMFLHRKIFKKRCFHSRKNR